MNTVVHDVDDAYDVTVPAQRSDREHILQPLADANAVAHGRMARGEGADEPVAPPSAQPPAEPRHLRQSAARTCARCSRAPSVREPPEDRHLAVE